MAELTTTQAKKHLHDVFTQDVMSMPEGSKIKQCQQCGACSGSCPTGYLMDHGPREVIAAFRAGMIDEILRGNTIWLCTSCYYCTVRCPAGIKITDLMYELKRLAIKYDLLPPSTKNPAMTKYFIDSVQRNGRNHEVELIGRFVMFKDPMMAFKFATTGLKLFAAGRLPLFPNRIKGRDELAKIAEFVESEEVAVP
jgi:heterodisulfide reductase subunit C